MKARGFTLIEFAVVVICIGILSGLLLERVRPLIGLAERTAFEQVRSQLSAALLLEAAERVARGESASLAAFEASNPMLLLLRPPANYAGSVYAPRPDSIPARNWYFDESTGLLVYRPGAADAFPEAGSRDAGLAFRVRFAFVDRNGDGSFDPSFDRFDGLALDPVEEPAIRAD